MTSSARIQHIVTPPPKTLQQSLCGDRFPSLFANSLGKGLSSPTVNVLWALANLVSGFLLFRAGKVASGGDVALVVFFTAIALISLWTSKRFAQKHTA